jgi:hypothetical protein
MLAVDVAYYYWRQAVAAIIPDTPITVAAQAAL